MHYSRHRLRASVIRACSHIRVWQAMTYEVALTSLFARLKNDTLD